MSTTSVRLILSVLLKPSVPSPKDTASLKETLPIKPQRIFHVSQLPAWMQWDPYIRHGYRAQLNSFKECFWSLFYLHNESVNIWSHMLPGLYFLTLLLVIDCWALQLPFQVPLSDILAIQAYVAGTAGCLILSAAFHATSAHSPKVATAFLKLDYLGIILSISTTCVSVAYFALHSNPAFQIAYISLTVLCAIMVFWISLDPRMDGARAGSWRATVFSLLAASGLAPILHVACAEGFAGLLRVPVNSLILTCASYATGTASYVTRFPEKYWAERFDLFGASHQIFHSLVAFGQIVHLFGLRKVLVNIHTGACGV